MLEPQWKLCLCETAVIELKWSWFNLVGTKSKPSDWLWAPPPFTRSYTGIYHLRWRFYVFLAECRRWSDPCTSDHSDWVRIKVQWHWLRFLFHLTLLKCIHNLCGLSPVRLHTDEQSQTHCVVSICMYVYSMIYTVVCINLYISCESKVTHISTKYSPSYS